LSVDIFYLYSKTLKNMPKILIIEDEAAIRRVLVKILTEENDTYQVEEAQDGLEGVEKIKNDDFDLILCDIKMPKMDGVEVLEAVKKLKPEIPIVMISGHGDLDTAVNTMRLGAFDYISKPPDLNRLLNTVRNALDRKELVVENKLLKKKVGKNFEMVGESKAISHIKDIIEKVAQTDARVLVTGPNGTGKELVAHWLHQKSERANGPMIEVNCAAIPSELIESELFGHVKGAFTSAVKDRAGKFEAANGGTIFLDEIGDMSLSAQAKVLRALQESRIQRVGSDKDIKVDVRVVAATNKNLKREIEEGRFREDLYHRLAVILIQVPPLNDRREDIPMLIDYFTTKIADEQGNTKKVFSKAAIKLLQDYDWTGNIRELRNVVERLIILGGLEVSEADVQLFASK
jgi:two-component system, NtrC family, nitrogen regulation response regulator NtrX